MNKLIFRVFGFSSVIGAVVLMSSCASGKLEKLTQDKMLKSTYYIWHTGVAPAGTGLNCEVSFFNPDMSISADSMQVNGEWYETEMNQKGDTTVIIGRYYVAPDLENPEDGVDAYFQAEKYSGRVRLISKDQTMWLTIEEFKKTLNRQMPL